MSVTGARFAFRGLAEIAPEHPWKTAKGVPTRVRAVFGVEFWHLDDREANPLSGGRHSSIPVVVGIGKVEARAFLLARHIYRERPKLFLRRLEKPWHERRK